MHSKSNLLALFNLAKSHLSKELLNEKYAHKVEKLHAFLPQLNMVNYELRLTNDNSRVDANIMVWKYEAPILLEWLSDKQESFYQELHKWVNDWIDPNKSFHTLIQNIWIMFDLESDDANIPEPWIVFSFSEFKLGKEIYLRLIKDLASYFENDFNSDHWSILESIYSNLNPEQTVPAIGFQNRNINSIRLGVKAFHNLDEIISYLQKISWEGDFNFIQDKYAQIISKASYSMLSMTFNNQLLPELGIECYLDEKNNLEHSNILLNDLVNFQLCAKKKSLALSKWIGNEYSEQSFATVQTKIENEKLFIKRWLLEIKLLVNPDKVPSAKAYLLINQTSS